MPPKKTPQKSSKQKKKPAKKITEILVNWPAARKRADTDAKPFDKSQYLKKALPLIGITKENAVNAFVEAVINGNASNIGLTPFQHHILLIVYNSVNIGEIRNRLSESLRTLSDIAQITM